jgi:hypothetical protein
MQLSSISISTNLTVRTDKDGLESWLLCIFVAITLALTISGAGGVARMFFVGAAGLLGLLFCHRNPSLYVQFVFWLWFLTPFLRRLLNFRSGYLETDPILAASLLATLACFPKLCRTFPILADRAALPFLLASSAVAYGFCIGVLFIRPLSSLLLETVNWVVPLFFGLFLFAEYRDHRNRASLTRAFENVFRSGTLVMGIYSVAQFIAIPAWDALWLTEVANPAFGTAEPFGVRVFSTMSSPLPLAVASFAGLILLMGQRGRLAVLSTTAGYASLALTCVRSAWGLWAIGTAFVLFRQGRKLGRFLVIAAAAIILLFVSTSLEPVQRVLKTRLETLSALREDGSFQARAKGYEDWYDYLASNPLGTGVGSMVTVLANKSEIGARDSGILNILLSLGWAGGAVYGLALVLVVWSALNPPHAPTPLEVAASAISIAMILHMVLSDNTAGFPGLVLWSFAGISVASRTCLNERDQPRYRAALTLSRKA